MKNFSLLCLCLSFLLVSGIHRISTTSAQNSTSSEGSLVLHYGFSDGENGEVAQGAGVITDTSATQANADAQGNPTYVDLPENRKGIAIDGIDDILFAEEQTEFAIDGSFTFFTRMKVGTHPTGPSFKLLYRGDSRPGLDAYQIALLSNGKLYFAIDNAASQRTDVMAPSSMPTGEFVDIKAQMDRSAGKMSLWINGEEVISRQTSAVPVSPIYPEKEGGVYIGNPFGGSNQMQVVIDDIQLHTGIVSDEILETIANDQQNTQNADDQTQTTDNDTQGTCTNQNATDPVLVDVAWPTSGKNVQFHSDGRVTNAVQGWMDANNVISETSFAGDGYVEAKVGALPNHQFFGISQVGYAGTMQFGVHVAEKVYNGGNLHVYVNGKKPSKMWGANDVIRIAYEDGSIVMTKNGAEFHSEDVGDIGDWKVKVVAHNSGELFRDFVVAVVPEAEVCEEEEVAEEEVTEEVQNNNQEDDTEVVEDSPNFDTADWGGSNKELAPGWVFDIAKSPNGKFLAVGMLNKVVRIYDAHTGTIIKDLPNGSHPSDVEFSPDSSTLLTSSRFEGALHQWDTSNWKKVKTVPNPTNSDFFRHMNDGNTVLTTTWPQGGSIVNLENGTREQINNHGGGVPALDASNQYAGIWWGDPHGNSYVDFVDMNGKQTVATKSFGKIRWSFIDFHPSEPYLLFGHDDTIHIINAKTQETIRTLNTEHGQMRDGEVSDDGKKLFTIGDDGLVKRWDFAALVAGDDVVLEYAQSVGTPLQRIEISPSGSRAAVITGEINGKRQVRLLETGYVSSDDNEGDEFELVKEDFTVDLSSFPLDEDLGSSILIEDPRGIILRVVSESLRVIEKNGKRYFIGNEKGDAGVSFTVLANPGYRLKSAEVKPLNPFYAGKFITTPRNLEEQHKREFYVGWKGLVFQGDVRNLQHTNLHVDRGAAAIGELKWGIVPGNPAINPYEVRPWLNITMSNKEFTPSTLDKYINDIRAMKTMFKKRLPNPLWVGPAWEYLSYKYDPTLWDNNETDNMRELQLARVRSVSAWQSTIRAHNENVMLLLEIVARDPGLVGAILTGSTKTQIRAGIRSGGRGAFVPAVDLTTGSLSRLRKEQDALRTEIDEYFDAMIAAAKQRPLHEEKPEKTGGGIEPPDSLTGEHRIFFEKLPIESQIAFLYAYQNDLDLGTETNTTDDAFAIGKFLVENSPTDVALVVGTIFPDIPEAMGEFSRVAMASYGLTGEVVYVGDTLMGDRLLGSGNFTWEDLAQHLRETEISIKTLEALADAIHRMNPNLNGGDQAFMELYNSVKSHTQKYVKLELFADSLPSLGKKTAWVIIHGRNSSSEEKNIKHLAQAVYDEREKAEGWDRIYTVNWSQLSSDNTPLGMQGADWIPAVANEVVAQLVKEGFESGDQINLIGHSWGSWLAYKIADGYDGVQSIVALDSAKGHNIVFGTKFNYSEVDFGKVSDESWSFKSSPLGSNTRAKTAEQAFEIDLPWFTLDPDLFHPKDIVQVIEDHGYAIDILRQLLPSKVEELGGNFELEFLTDDDHTYSWDTDTKDYDGIIRTGDPSGGTKPPIPYNLHLYH